MTEKTVFIEIFGEHPLLKVLDFFMVYEDFDYSMTDIAKFSGVGYSTLKLFWDKLEKEKFVVLTRTVGKAKMYKLNLRNPVIQDFKKLYWTVTKQKVHEDLGLIEKEQPEVKKEQIERPITVAH